MLSVSVSTNHAEWPRTATSSSRPRRRWMPPRRSPRIRRSGVRLSMPRAARSSTGCALTRRTERGDPGGEPAGDPPLIRARMEQPPVDGVAQEARLREHDRHVGPVEAREVGALDDAQVAGTGRPHETGLDRTSGAAARAVNVIRPAPVEGRRQRRDPALRVVRRAAGMDPKHQRGAASVAEPGARDVPAAVAGTGARHRHSVPTPQQQRTRPPCDLERDVRLTRSAAAVLDLRDAGAGADRLALPPDRRKRAVAGVEADERGGESLYEHASMLRTMR